MRILYIFSHPDDESFGPARVMSKQRREGHAVYPCHLRSGDLLLPVSAPQVEYFHFEWDISSIGR